METKDWVSLLAVVVGGLTFAVGLWQYGKAQRWKRAEFVANLSQRSGIELGTRPQQVAKTLGLISYGEAEQFFLDLARRQVLSMGERSAADIAKEQLGIWASRARSTQES